MIVPHTTVQLTDEAVQKFIALFNPDAPLEPDLRQRRAVLRELAQYDDMFRHAGVVFIAQMADQLEIGIFATHEGTIKVGYEIEDFEPYIAADHGDEFA